MRITGCSAHVCTSHLFVIYSRDITSSDSVPSISKPVSAKWNIQNGFAFLLDGSSRQLCRETVDRFGRQINRNVQVRNLRISIRYQVTPEEMKEPIRQERFIIYSRTHVSDNRYVLRNGRAVAIRFARAPVRFSNLSFLGARQQLDTSSCSFFPRLRTRLRILNNASRGSVTTFTHRIRQRRFANRTVIRARARACTFETDIAIRKLRYADRGTQIADACHCTRNVKVDRFSRLTI